MQQTVSAESIAVFIDVENFARSAEELGIPVFLKPIIERIREDGQIVFSRAYADWSQPRVARHLGEFRDITIEMTEVWTSEYGKNTADMQLAVDALEMALLPSSPSAFVIVSGDRDFVPLVQKIKRYGKTVIGIGVSEENTSRALIQACHSFLFASELLPGESDGRHQAGNDGQTEEESAEAAGATAGIPSSRQKEALRLLARAVAACARQGETASEETVKRRMQQLKSTFYLSRYGYKTFLELAEDAERHGYARVREVASDGGVLFDIQFQPDAELLREERAVEESEYDSAESAAFAYRRILKTRKHLDVLPLADRQRLVRDAWSFLNLAGPEGRSYRELIEHLFSNASGQTGMPLARKAVELVVRTLSIGKCFQSTDSGAPPYFEDQERRVRPADGVDVEEALFRMHQTYLRGIHMEEPDTPFRIDGVARFLFESTDSDARAQAERLLSSLNIKPVPELTSMGQAFIGAAKGQGGSAEERD